MKRVVMARVSVSLLFFGFGWFTSQFHSEDSFPRERSFRIRYAAAIENIPADAGKLRVWVPLAGDREGQKILNRNIAAPAGFQITKDPEYGNEIVYFEMAPPLPHEVQVTIDYTAKVAPGSAADQKDHGKLGLYLKPSRLMFVSPEVKDKTQSAIRDRQSTSERARGIYDYVIRHMIYEKTTPGWGRGDSLRACLIGRGNCTDFHSLFISMAHAAEIAARFKIGLTVPEGEAGAIPGYHCWAEFYEEGIGWKPVDASEAWKYPERKEAYFGNFDTNKFLISVGRDIQLVPEQAGPPVNIFFQPYVEVDGKEWQGVKTAFQFENLKP